MAAVAVVVAPMIAARAASLKTAARYEYVAAKAAPTGVSPNPVTRVSARALNAVSPYPNPRIVARTLQFQATYATSSGGTAHSSAFAYGSIALPYLEVFDVTTGNVLKRINQLRGSSSRIMSDPFVVPAGVTQVKVRFGSGGLAAKAGTTINVGQFKLEVGALTNYTPGIAAEANGGVAATEFKIGPNFWITHGTGAPTSSTKPGIYVRDDGSDGSFCYVSFDAATWTKIG